jgi:putative component of toxin-antitoxin plasmid stabilization module
MASMKCALITVRVTGCISCNAGQTIIVLLAGGDKRTQDTDINRAIEIAHDWKG